VARRYSNWLLNVDETAESIATSTVARGTYWLAINFLLLCACKHCTWTSRAWMALKLETPLDQQYWGQVGKQISKLYQLKGRRIQPHQAVKIKKQVSNRTFEGNSVRLQILKASIMLDHLPILECVSERVPTPTFLWGEWVPKFADFQIWHGQGCLRTQDDGWNHDSSFDLVLWPCWEAANQAGIDRGSDD
jgi:hypothetical protein